MKRYLAIFVSIIMLLSTVEPILADEPVLDGSDIIPEITVDIIESDSTAGQAETDMPESGAAGEETVEEEPVDNEHEETQPAENEEEAIGDENLPEKAPVPTEAPTEAPDATEPPVITSTPEAEENEEENDISELSLGSPESDTWTAQTSMNEGRANADYIIAGDDLYIIGGTGETGYLNTIEKYNETSDTWQNVTSIPGGPKGFAAAATETDIYIAGGYENGDYSNRVQVYNISAGTWSDMAPMQEKRDLAAAFCMDNKLYVIGGRNRNGFVNSYEFYDFSTNEWNLVTTGFAESMIRTGAKAKYIQGYVCVYGGIDKDYSRAGVDLYLASDLENEQEVLADGYKQVSVAWGETKAIILAGQSMITVKKELSIVDDSVDVADVIMNMGNQSWQYGRYMIYNGYMRRVGGYTAAGYRNDFGKYSVYYGDFVPGEGIIESEVTNGGNQITLNAEAGKEYMLFVNVKNIASFDGYTFTIEYPSSSFEIIDGCALTAKNDTSTGAVQGADISITEYKANGISFICTEPLSGEEAISKGVNAVLLRANSSGQRTIKYSMTEE